MLKVDLLLFQFPDFDSWVGRHWPRDGSGAGGAGSADRLLLSLELTHHIRQLQLKGVTLLQQLQNKKASCDFLSYMNRY